MYNRLWIIIFVFALALIFNNCKRYMEPNTPEIVPLVIIEAPDDGAIIKESTVITVRIENIENIDKVVFYCNEEIIFEDMEEPYQANWNIVKLNDGNYQLQVKVIDDTGFQFQSKPISVIVAKEKKTFTLTLSSDSRQWEGYIERTRDNNYLVSGATLLAKIDDWGSELFKTTLDYGPWGKGKCISETTNGGYIILGDKIGIDAGSPVYSWGKIFLQKIDSYANKIWQKEFEFRVCNHASSICLTNDNCFIVTGATHNSDGSNGDIFILKTDAEGNEMWRKLLGGQSQDWGYDILQTSDNDYLVLGTTDQRNYDISLIKMDSAGDIMWSKTFGGEYSDTGNSFIETSDGNILIAGSTTSYNANSPDMFLLKIDNSGNELWHKKFGGDKEDVALSVIEGELGGYVITGYTWSYGAGDSDIYVVKTNDSGELIWQKTFGDANYDAGTSIQNTFDGGYIITGSKNYDDIWIIKMDAEGNI